MFNPSQHRSSRRRPGPRWDGWNAGSNGSAGNQPTSAFVDLGPGLRRDERFNGGARIAGTRAKRIGTESATSPDSAFVHGNMLYLNGLRTQTYALELRSRSARAAYSAPGPGRPRVS